MNYLARPGQYLNSHLEGTAQKTKDRLPPILKLLGYYVGLWHDIGKYAPSWQIGIERIAKGEKVSNLPQHAIHGAVLASEQKLLQLAFAIAGHHGGLRDRNTLFERIKDNQALAQEAIGLAKRDFAGLIQPITPPTVKSALHAEFLTRILFSALVDGDRLDCAIHEGDQLEHYPSLINLAAKCPQPQQKSGELNQLRDLFLSQCLEAANQPPGFFSLVGPTGIGKTLAILAFALSHAKFHGLERLVYVAPYCSILEQTADAFRAILRENAVLEHHSSFPIDDDEAKLYRDACARWMHPVICTSSVQFFESLFSNRPSDCRKLVSLHRSVILLDEVQTLPTGVLKPSFEMLTHLADYLECSVVFCTATLPDFEKLLGRKSHTVISSTDQIKYFDACKRVEYEFVGEKTWDALNQELPSERCLIIVNTTDDAREGYQLLKQGRKPYTFHLSARMYPAHRQQVLLQIKQRLDDQLSCILVATQCVEAGVNLDFPAGYRAFAPLDALIQSAGRVNREGSPQIGKMKIFHLASENSKAVQRLYGSKLEYTRSALKCGMNLHSSGAMAEYTKLLFNDSNLDQKNISFARSKFQFEKVANEFQMIAEGRPVIVQYGPVPSLLRKLEAKNKLCTAAWRELQQYSVNLFEGKFEQWFKDGLIKEFRPDPDLSLYLMLWAGKYDECGLSANRGDTNE